MKLKRLSIKLVFMAIFILIIIQAYIIIFSGSLNLGNYIKIQEVEIVQNSISIKGELYDSGMVIKRCKFKEKGNEIFLYIYTGLKVFEKESGELDEVYSANTDNIDKIILMGRQGKQSVIWERDIGYK